MDEFLKRYFDKIIFKILLLIIICSVCIGLMLFYFHTSAQKEMLTSEIGNRSIAVGNSIAFVLTKAIQMGIPFDEMVEVNKFLSANDEGSQDLDYIAITNAKGDTLYKSNSLPNSLKGSFKRFALSSQSDKELKSYDVLDYRNIPIKITYDSNLYGYLHLGVSKKVTTNRIMDIYYDILTILFVAMITGSEFFLFTFRNKIQLTMMDLFSVMKKITDSNFTSLTYIRTVNSISAVTQKFNNIISIIASEYNVLKIQVEKISENHNNVGQFLMGRDQLRKFNKAFRVLDNVPPLQETSSPVVENMRLPAFLMVLAETVLVAILPSYASQFYDPTWGISKEFISSSPVLVFMISSTLGVLIASGISYRLGFRKILLIGLYISTFGYLVSFLTSGLCWMLIARAIAALGYGVSYASFQNYIASYAPADRKIQSYAIFAVAFGAAYICGAPIGGILVDNIGYQFTFGVAAIASITSMLFTRNFVVDFAPNTLKKERETEKNPKDLLKNTSFMVTLIGAGMPVRLMFSSLICLFYPLYLRNLGFSQSSIGRNLMIFGVITFAFSSFAAKSIEKFRKYNSLILFMSVVLIGIAILVPRIVHSDFAPSLAVSIYATCAVVNTCTMMSILEEFSVREYKNYRKSTILNYYFVTERMGMIMGPAIISFLLHAVSFTGTMTILAIFMFVCSIVYGTYQLFKRRPLEEISEEGINP